MAFILGDSCDHYNDANRLVKWNGVLDAVISGNHSAEIVSLSGLSGTLPNILKGTQAIRFKYTGNQPSLDFPAAAFYNFTMVGDTLFSHFSVYVAGVFNASLGGPIFGLRGGLGAYQIYAELSSTGNLSFWRNSTTTPDVNFVSLGPQTLNLPTGRWVSVLVKTKFSAGTGTITIWLDGHDDPDLELINLNTDIAATGNANAIFYGIQGLTLNNQYRKGGGGLSVSHTVDFLIRDTVLWDGSGATWNDQKHSLFLERLGVNAQGNYAAWTRAGVDSGANFSQVNETVAIDNATKYLKASAAATKDSYITGDSAGPVASTVAGVLVTVVGEKEGGGQGIWRGLMRLSSTDGFGANAVLPQGWAHSQSLIETDPSAGAISVQDINDAEWGMEVVTP